MFRKFAVEGGSRNHWEAKFVSTYIDIAPTSIVEVNRVLQLDECLIRVHTIRAPSAAGYINARRYLNPHWVKVKRPQDAGPQPHFEDT